MRLSGYRILAMAPALVIAGAALAQDATLPGLTRSAVASCEGVIRTGGTIADQRLLHDFERITIPGTDEAWGRGFRGSGDAEFYVKVMRGRGACVVMVRDTVRNEAGAAVEGWLRSSGIVLQSQPDGFRTARRNGLDYRYYLAQDGIHVVFVGPAPT